MVGRFYLPTTHGQPTRLGTRGGSRRIPGFKTPRKRLRPSGWGSNPRAGSYRRFPPGPRTRCRRPPSFEEAFIHAGIDSSRPSEPPGTHGGAFSTPPVDGAAWCVPRFPIRAAAGRLEGAALFRSNAGGDQHHRPGTNRRAGLPGHHRSRSIFPSTRCSRFGGDSISRVETIFVQGTGSNQPRRSSVTRSRVRGEVHFKV